MFIFLILYFEMLLFILVYFKIRYLVYIKYILIVVDDRDIIIFLLYNSGLENIIYRIIFIVSYFFFYIVKFDLLIELFFYR